MPLRSESSRTQAVTGPKTSHSTDLSHRRGPSDTSVMRKGAGKVVIHRIEEEKRPSIRGDRESRLGTVSSPKALRSSSRGLHGIPSQRGRHTINLASPTRTKALRVDDDNESEDLPIPSPSPVPMLPSPSRSSHVRSYLTQDQVYEMLLRRTEKEEEDAREGVQQKGLDKRNELLKSYKGNYSDSPRMEKMSPSNRKGSGLSRTLCDRITLEENGLRLAIENEYRRAQAKIKAEQNSSRRSATRGHSSGGTAPSSPRSSNTSRTHRTSATPLLGVTNESKGETELFRLSNLPRSSIESMPCSTAPAHPYMSAPHLVGYYSSRSASRPWTLTDSMASRLVSPNPADVELIPLQFHGDSSVMDENGVEVHRFEASVPSAWTVQNVRAPHELANTIMIDYSASPAYGANSLATNSVSQNPALTQSCPRTEKCSFESVLASEFEHIAPNSSKWQQVINSFESLLRGSSYIIHVENILQIRTETFHQIRTKSNETCTEHNLYRYGSVAVFAPLLASDKPGSTELYDGLWNGTNLSYLATPVQSCELLTRARSFLFGEAFLGHIGIDHDPYSDASYRNATSSFHMHYPHQFITQYLIHGYIRASKNPSENFPLTPQSTGPPSLTKLALAADRVSRVVVELQQQHRTEIGAIFDYTKRRKESVDKDLDELIQTIEVLRTETHKSIDSAIDSDVQSLEEVQRDLSQANTCIQLLLTFHRTGVPLNPMFTEAANQTLSDWSRHLFGEDTVNGTVVAPPPLRSSIRDCLSRIESIPLDTTLLQQTITALKNHPKGTVYGDSEASAPLGDTNTSISVIAPSGEDIRKAVPPRDQAHLHCSHNSTVSKMASKSRSPSSISVNPPMSRKNRVEVVDQIDTVLINDMGEVQGSERNRRTVQITPSLGREHSPTQSTSTMIMSHVDGGHMGGRGKKSTALDVGTSSLRLRVPSSLKETPSILGSVSHAPIDALSDTLLPRDGVQVPNGLQGSLRPGFPRFLSTTASAGSSYPHPQSVGLETCLFKVPIHELLVQPDCTAVSWSLVCSPTAIARRTDLHIGVAVGASAEYWVATNSRDEMHLTTLLSDPTCSSPNSTTVIVVVVEKIGLYEARLRLLDDFGRVIECRAVPPWPAHFESYPQISFPRLPHVTIEMLTPPMSV